ncbi:hypothetical protein ABIB86_000447 [Bradyrhizobium sp. JR1.7]|uniref:HNH endonuclease n=1 Tax=unclassified Bradyrhizobium TaxID=2631580 RepID=UPI00339A5938
MKLTHEHLLEVLHYDHVTGIFRWRRSYRRAVAGNVAGHKNHRGYVMISVGGRLFLAHRLAFFYMTGEWPIGLIDHEDTDKSNNRWVNLRDANSSQNGANSKLACNNSSGFKGVSWDAESCRWQAFIHIDGRTKRLGRFDSAEEAAASYQLAALANFGEFARAA